MYEECNREAGCCSKQAHYEAPKSAIPRSAQRRASSRIAGENQHKVRQCWECGNIVFTCWRSTFESARKVNLGGPQLTFPIGPAQSRPPPHLTSPCSSRVYIRKLWWTRWYMHARRCSHRLRSLLLLMCAERRCCCRAPIGIGKVVLESLVLGLTVGVVEVPLLSLLDERRRRGQLLRASLLCHPLDHFHFSLESWKPVS